MIITIENDEGAAIDYGLLMVYALNGTDYAALIPLKEDGEPADADVALYLYQEKEGTDDFDLCEIGSEEEYSAAAGAFSKAVDAVMGGA